MAVYPDANRVLVQGVNIMKRHVRDQADPNTGRTTKGGVINSEAPIHASNVQLVTKDADGNEVLTRAGSQRVEGSPRPVPTARSTPAPVVCVSPARPGKEI